MATHAAKRAELHRMVMENHTCPYGLKALDLLKREGYEVDDHHLTTRAETDAFKAKHDVQSTPQTFIGGKRIGGYDDLVRFFGGKVEDKDAVTYKPVIALFAMAALMALAASSVAGCAKFHFCVRVRTLKIKQVFSQNRHKPSPSR